MPGIDITPSTQVEPGDVDANGKILLIGGYVSTHIREFALAVDDPFRTTTGHTGFAYNGKKYTNGVEQAVANATWHTEGASAYRGPDADFPLKGLVICETSAAMTSVGFVTIWDTANAAAPKLWMRIAATPVALPWRAPA